MHAIAEVLYKAQGAGDARRAGAPPLRRGRGASAAATTWSTPSTLRRRATEAVATRRSWRRTRDRAESEESETGRAERAFGEFADRLHGDHWQPDVDVFETEEAVVVRVELAGVRRDDLRVTVDGDLLRIRGCARARRRPRVRLHQMEIATRPVRAPPAHRRPTSIASA